MLDHPWPDALIVLPAGPNKVLASSMMSAGSFEAAGGDPGPALLMYLSLSASTVPGSRSSDTSLTWSVAEVFHR